MLTETVNAYTVDYNVHWVSDLTKTSTTAPAPFETTNTITITASSGSTATTTTTDTTTFKLKVKNPCVDALYNSIIAPSDDSVYYEVSSVAKTIDYSSGFSLELAMQSLCGTISYTTTLSTGPAYVNNAPATTFTIYTTD